MTQAILRQADEKQPPVRLLIGSDAVALAAAAAAVRAAENARWKALSVSTDYDAGRRRSCERRRALGWRAQRP